MRADSCTWWCHDFSANGDSGQLLSVHGSTREAVAMGRHLAREMHLELTVWRGA